MENKDLVRLLLKEIKEMSLLCESLSSVSGASTDNIPVPLLQLSRSKVDTMSEILSDLIEKAEAGSVASQTKEEEKPQPMITKKEEPGSKFDEKREEIPVEAKEQKVETSSNVGKNDVVKAEVSTSEAPLTKSREQEEEPKPSKIKRLANATKETFSKLTESIKQDSPESQKEKKVEVVTPNSKKEVAKEKAATEVVATKISGKEEKRPEKKKEHLILPTKECVGDVLENHKKNSVATIESRFVRSLKLSLGDRYLYQRELFGGDMALLNKTMSELDKLDSLSDALRYIEKFGWDEEDEVTISFLNLLQNRFS
jgi:chemotaxis protein histidine kinase CheA